MGVIGRWNERRKARKEARKRDYELLVHNREERRHRSGNAEFPRVAQGQSE